MEPQEQRPPMWRRLTPAIIISITALLGVWVLEGMSPAPRVTTANDQSQPYPLHENIRATTFWVGEDADKSNAFIDNHASAWSSNWTGMYGGIDSPDQRCGNNPCAFTPKENPFYIALPYNDLDDRCRIKDSQSRAPWYAGPMPKGQSIIKNRWIEIHFKDRIAYAQWEDAGPAGEDDADYVFGTAKPAVMYGLDLSPAAARYLGTGGDDIVSWRFASEAAVPSGPWKVTVTVSAPDCAKQ